MSWEAWVTLATVVGVVVVLSRDVLTPAVTILAGTVLLLVVGVISPEQAFSGFSNPAPITVAALYVLAGAAEKTGALQPLVRVVFGRNRGMRRPLGRLLALAAGSSAFLNNTPIVAMLTPQVSSWVERRGQAASRYLMPLSFAAILGGVTTLIGTSTNLVISGLLEARGQPPLGMFELSPVGLPIAVAGLIALVILAPILLPERRGSRQQAEEEVREFVVQMAVEQGGRLDGLSVEEGGLRHLQGLFLVQIERGTDRIAPVTPSTVLRGGDRLTFVGRADLVLELQRIRGLVSAEQEHVLDVDSPGHTFFEAVIGEASPLVGRTLKSAAFRERYQAAVVAIHRAGQRVDSKLGQVRLKVGDTLLILADPGFRRRWKDQNHFLLVSRFGGASPHASRHAVAVGMVAAAIVLLAATGTLPILHASLLGALVLLATRVLTPAEARSAINLDVIVVIAAAFGLGAAVEASGLSEVLVDVLIAPLGAFGAVGALLGIIACTLLLTELITNNAAAILIFPIAIQAAERWGGSPREFAIAVAVAASCSFLTPIGYQTNTMVYGPGGYRFSDYARLGAPLTVIVVIGIVLVLYLRGSL